MIESLDPSAVIGIAIGYLIAGLIRFAGRSRFWTAVAKRAQRYLEDPRVPISEPSEAAERALIDEQRRSVNRVARKLTPSTPPPTTESLYVRGKKKLGDDDDTPKTGGR